MKSFASDNYAGAHPDVLAAADEITTTNEDAGVALVLERLFSPRADPTEMAVR